MSFLFLTILLGLGVVGVLIAYWTDNEFRGAGVAWALLVAMLLIPVACAAYGAYVWLRVGTWGSITVLDTLMFLKKLGVDVGIFFEPVPWVGLQTLSEQYLSSNLGSTLFVISMALIWFWDIISRRGDQSQKHGAI